MTNKQKTFSCEHNKEPGQTTYIIGELGSRQLFELGFWVSSNSNCEAIICTTQGEHLDNLIYVYYS